MKDNVLRSSRVKCGPQKQNARALYKAAGLTDEEINRPFIGVSNSWSNIIPGHVHLDKIGQAVMDGIRIAGGTPVVFETMAICDAYPMSTPGMRYSLPSRELIANSVESVCEANGLDGVVLVASCDKIVPGMMLGALRLDIPTIMVTGGPMMAGKYHGKRIELRSSMEITGLLKAGKITEKEFLEFEDESCPGCGSCKGMYTANSMCCVAEVLGLALPGNGTIPAVHARRMRLAKQTGMRIVDMVREGLTSSKIVTAKSFRNAIVADMLLGCSTNTALHLPAIAGAGGIELRLGDFDAASSTTPQIVKLNPAGVHAMEDLDDAGGISAVLKLGIDAGLVDGEVLTVTGRTLAENVSDVKVWNDEVIRPIDKPYAVHGGLMVLRGNLAPDGAVIKSGGVVDNMRVHTGRARVFDSEQSAMGALLADRIHPGDVLVVRYEGPKGGPGMQEMLAITGFLSGSGMDCSVAIITDGRFSGGSRGCAIGHISPEAAVGGPIAFVEEGDLISINLDERRLDMLVDEAVLQRRKDMWIPKTPKTVKGWLAQYSALVGSASTGAQMESKFNIYPPEKPVA